MVGGRLDDCCTVDAFSSAYSEYADGHRYQWLCAFFRNCFASGCTARSTQMKTCNHEEKKGTVKTAEGQTGRTSPQFVDVRRQCVCL